jgi:hypothetical protein
MNPETFDDRIKRLERGRVTRMTALRGLLGGALAGGALATGVGVAIA